MKTPLKGHRREYIKSMRHAGNTYSYSVKCECGWSEFLNNSRYRSAVEAHRYHKAAASQSVELEMWQDVIPGVGVCRYCGYAPGPVCGAYACNIKDNEEAISDDMEGSE